MGLKVYPPSAWFKVQSSKVQGIEGSIILGTDCADYTDWKEIAAVNRADSPLRYPILNRARQGLFFRSG